MKITAFDELYPNFVGSYGTILGQSTGSNGIFGGDVVGDPGDLSVVGLRSSVSLQSNMTPVVLGDVLTIVQASPAQARFATSSNAALAFGSNAMDVSGRDFAGTTGTYIGANHEHLGVSAVTSSSSNTLQRPIVNLRAGANIGLTATDSDGDGNLDTVTITGKAAAGGGGTTVGGRALLVPAEFLPGGTTSTVALTANQAYLIQFRITATMLLRGLVFAVTVTGTGTVQWGLFDSSSSISSASKLAGGSASLGSTGLVTIAASGAPVTVQPGYYNGIILAPAANLPTIRRLDNVGAVSSPFLKFQNSYTWDDTPDIGTGWSTATVSPLFYLLGDADGSTQF